MWVRPGRVITSIPITGFQFTHPCGCDAKLFHQGFFRQVSIHAPVWVRLASTRAHAMSMRFQFTHPCGCDHSHAAKLPIQYQFQFTHPCGCDFYNVYVVMWLLGFNSRTRVGATRAAGKINLLPKVSIHAPVWVRPGPKPYPTAGDLFQFTHPCGCDGLTNTV